MSEEEDEAIRFVAEAQSISVWGFVTQLLWSVFALVFVLTIFGIVPWMSPIAPLVLAVLSSATNPASRMAREKAATTKGK